MQTHSLWRCLARGGGKSWAVRAKAILLALVYPGIRILIVRRSYPQLKANHIDVMRADLYGIARYMATDKEFIFPNGSRIIFGYCDTDTDVERYQGVEYDVIFLDEATTLREEWVKKIVASMRGANSFPKRTYYTMNPGGESHAYFKRLFVDKRYEASENPDDYVFIQSLVTDNQALMEMQPDYLRQLEALPYKLRQAWRFGSWDILEGVFFEEFRDEPEHYIDRIGTHVIEPFDIPKHWPIYRSFDWGRAKPYACLWWTIDQDGVAYAILESYGIGREPNEGCMWDADQVFMHIAETEQTHPWLKGKNIIGVADPSIWQKDTGTSVYDVAAKKGVYFSPGDNKRIPGWLQMHYRMRFDDTGVPRMYIFKNCQHLIRTIPLMMYDKRKVEDLDTALEDHACVTGDTMIKTPNGWVRIDTMREGGLTLGHDQRYHEISACGMTQMMAAVYEVTTDDGRTIKATADHLFMMADGTWKRLDELIEGDEIMDAAKVTVISNTAQEFMGIRYYKCGQYFQRKGARLHRKVWEFFNGAVPEGHHVHHVDGNKDNNAPENLMLMDGTEHLSGHMTRERRKAGSALCDRIRPLTKAWHASEAGREWHSKHMKENLQKSVLKEYVCTNCGKSFQTKAWYKADENRFCGNNCKSAYRRKMKYDYVHKPCAICGKDMFVNKYSHIERCSRWCKP